MGSAVGARDGGRRRDDWMRRAGLRQCMDHDAVGSGRARGLVGGKETAAATSRWGRRRRYRLLRYSRRRLCWLSLWVRSGALGGSEVSLRDHVPVVHRGAAKFAKMEAYVECCIWPGEREALAVATPDLLAEVVTCRVSRSRSSRMSRSLNGPGGVSRYIAPTGGGA